MLLGTLYDCEGMKDVNIKYFELSLIMKLLSPLRSSIGGE
jgi:hypothetical protein